MKLFNREKHWEHIYNTRKAEETSWYQPTPSTSLEFISKFRLTPEAKIIDVGGGDSLLIDNLIDLGFKDLTVLDISISAINRARARLGKRGDFVKWVNSDITKYFPESPFDLWHDRATFHFLTDEKDINSYIQVAKRGIKSAGIMLIATFSKTAPDNCSGLPVKKYSRASLSAVMSAHFKKLKCVSVNHITPFNTVQNFTFCSFKKTG
ncbi:MAG: class I SAM-dependent methyltransferase [Ignavibacteriaceae bacterium]|jgi:Methylase involved in ubiquinone/menaquinone biosynthesis|nr:MAG: class I SAM-dependent methyltransferase [Chlorobiota bacterium]KXK05755.1 MAG: methyltransferase type 12 [Chlorobi bacterium OLB4]MBV6398413.1 hypothetical protein [Ignavibacteria bacterium]MCC6885995.1 class I SAM-dependent methyltransferase [Ignavibacteriales bacterium]MCE7952755.1 class I SAM-dependent methyltransferase [Chlorobi bacterium CHB7]MDL1886865.1 class I SAM-dependent methyltransferase [Ignavibacteria bacterium CHB1]MEB2330225.1 class I SAM-dependent methyltransferase [I